MSGRWSMSLHNATRRVSPPERVSTRACPGGADEVRVRAGHDPEQRALARAVGAEHADLSPGIERQPDVAQDLFLAVGLRQILDCEDVLWGHLRSLCAGFWPPASAPAGRG